MLGGVLADFVRPAQVATLPEEVQAGIRLHRQIDGFTDRHVIVQRSIGRISGTVGWFAGIVIDVYYDHLLAREWPLYSEESLRPFADRAYAALETLPPIEGEGANFIRRFIEDDRLLKYATREGIGETLSRLSDRIAARIPRQAVRLESAMPELIAADAQLAADFHTFYPELMRFVEEARASRK